MKNPLKPATSENYAKELEQVKDKLLTEHELWLDIKLGHNQELTVFGEVSYATIRENEKSLVSDPAVYQISETSLDRIFSEINYERFYRIAKENIVGRSFNSPGELVRTVAGLINHHLPTNYQVVIQQEIFPVELRLTTEKLLPLINAHKTWIRSKGKNGFKLTLDNKDLRFAFLCDADLQEVDLHKTNLSGAILCNANLEQAIFDGCDIIGSNLAEARFRKANLQNTRLYNSSFSHTDMIEANLVRADLSGSNLSSARLMEADLTYTNFVGADLTYADFSGANIKNTNFQLARLTGTKGIEDSNIASAAIEGSNTSHAPVLETEQLVRNAEQLLLQSPMLKLSTWVIFTFLTIGIALWLGGTIYSGIQIQSIKDQSESVLNNMEKQQLAFENSSRNVMDEVEKAKQSVDNLKSSIVGKIAEDRLEIDSHKNKASQEIEQRKNEMINYIANEKQNFNSAVSSALADISDKSTKSRVQINKETINAVDAITKDRNEAKKALDLESLLELSKIQDQISKLKKSGKPIKFFEFRHYLDNTTQILLASLSLALIFSLITNLWMFRRISKK